MDLSAENRDSTAQKIEPKPAHERTIERILYLSKADFQRDSVEWLRVGEPTLAIEVAARVTGTELPHENLMMARFVGPLEPSHYRINLDVPRRMLEALNALRSNFTTEDARDELDVAIAWVQSTYIDAYVDGATRPFRT